ncbi:MAG: agmatinase [Planctomycetota bacterium]|nr:agmatinase [Planctomycetota bacterium]
MSEHQSSRTTLPNARHTPRFAGIATFCRFPMIDQVPKEQQPVDWALYGIPFDGGVTFRGGAKFAPRAIREASQYIKPVHPVHGVDLSRVFSMSDAGDAPVKPYSCQETLEIAAAFAKDIGEPSHTRLLAIGGDHSIAYANLKATWERRGRPEGGLAMLHFDAHLDTTDVVWDQKWTHASPFIRAIEDGLLDPKRMLSLGIRGPLNSLADLDYGRDHGIEIVTYEDWRSGDANSRISNFLRRIGHDDVYLTFDIDSIDPAYAPGTGTPCCGGFTSAEAFELIRNCKGVNLVGADVVEVLPDRDPTGITSLLAAHVIYEILGLAALSDLG